LCDGVNRRVQGEEVPGEPINEKGAYQTLLDEELVVPSRRVKLAETVRHPRAARYAVQLAFEHPIGHRSFPVPFERDGLLEVGPDLPLDHSVRDDLIERPRRPNLVSVVDPLDSLVHPNALVEGEISSDRISQHTAEG